MEAEAPMETAAFTQVKVQRLLSPLSYAKAPIFSS